MVLRRLDRIGAKRDPWWRDRGAVYRDSNNVVCRGACDAMVVAPRLVHHWNRGDGWPRSSSEEFVSLPGDLDLAALDSGYGSGIANIVCGGRSNARHCAPTSAQAERSPVGGHGFPDDVVGGFVTSVRGRSKPRDRDIL